MDWFIQLHKKICEWEWYTDIPTKTLFLHILLKCNYKEAKWRWIDVKPWDFITSLDHLAQETWLTVRQVRTALEHLEKTWEVTKQSTSQYTILTLNNWSSYNTRDDKPTTNEWQTNDKPTTTTNKEYKDNKEYKENNNTLVALQPNEYLETMNYLRSYEIETDIPEYAESYRDEWIKFCMYWSEKGKTGKIRAEWEKTFEIKKRFATWMSRKKDEYTKTLSSNISKVW